VLCPEQALLYLGGNFMPCHKDVISSVLPATPGDYKVTVGEWIRAKTNTK
jgi:hypothetical protein